jgi:hypothetical protein
VITFILTTGPNWYKKNQNNHICFNSHLYKFSPPLCPSQSSCKNRKRSLVKSSFVRTLEPWGGDRSRWRLLSKTTGKTMAESYLEICEQLEFTWYRGKSELGSWMSSWDRALAHSAPITLRQACGKHRYRVCVDHKHFWTRLEVQGLQITAASKVLLFEKCSEMNYNWNEYGEAPGHFRKLGKSQITFTYTL